MGKGIRKPGASHASERIALGELIHQRGYRNGTKARALTGLSGPGALTGPALRCSARRNGPRRFCRAISGGYAPTERHR